MTSRIRVWLIKKRFTEKSKPLSNLSTTFVPISLKKIAILMLLNKYEWFYRKDLFGVPVIVCCCKYWCVSDSYMLLNKCEIKL